MLQVSYTVWLRHYSIHHDPKYFILENKGTYQYIQNKADRNVLSLIKLLNKVGAFYHFYRGSNTSKQVQPREAAMPVTLRREGAQNYKQSRVTYIIVEITKMKFVHIS